MNFSIIHKVFSILLSFIVVFSTLSFTVEKHYCGGNLIDSAVFSKAKKCGGLDSEIEVYIKKPCCKDTVDVVEGQDKLSTSDVESIDFKTELALSTFVYTYINLFESLPKQVIPHKDYSPPLLVKDIQVLDETYRI